MLVLKERLTGVPVMSLQTGAEIARTDRPVIDPRQLTIVAFYCHGQGVTVDPAILHVEDIREAGSLGFIVDSADVIMPPDDLVRLQQVIGFNFVLEGKQVVDDTGHKLGKVTNYTVDLHSFYITQLQVQPSIWHSWGTAQLLIGRSQIIEISDVKILVRSTKNTSPETVPAKLVDNPFRPSHAQPEASRAVHDA